MLRNYTIQAICRCILDYNKELADCLPKKELPTAERVEDSLGDPDELIQSHPQENKRHWQGLRVSGAREKLTCV
jgi:hypothetical protein